MSRFLLLAWPLSQLPSAPDRRHVESLHNQNRDAWQSWCLRRPELLAEAAEIFFRAASRSVRALAARRYFELRARALQSLKSWLGSDRPDQIPSAAWELQKSTRPRSCRYWHKSYI